MLLTPFFRCPSKLQDLDETSPRVCKPYLITRSHVEPYVTPYYDAYAAPYAEQARPYVEVFNQQVYMPASKIAKSGYDQYGAPAWQQAQAFGAAQWKAQVTPRLEAVQGQAQQAYMAKVDPYVQQGKAVVAPYYQKANSAMLTVYWDHFVPFYTRSQPFIAKTYVTGQGILATHVVPGARYTWSSVVFFANSSLWPHITGLYSEQVEPQLIKIGQRLASYREGKRLRAVVEDLDRYGADFSLPERFTLTAKSSTSSEQLTTSSVLSAKIQPQTSVHTTASSSTETSTVQPTLSPEEEMQQARVRIDTDLQRWQEKFAFAANKGVEDLEARIEEIVSALVKSSVNSHGQSLSTALQTIAGEQVATIKQQINDLAQSLPEEEALEAEELARGQLVNDIRKSAISVRDRAHALREWSISFDHELIRRVTAAINSTLDILDNVRDLGLQEIGIRWAWMDGVTYKDWARYHALKAQLEDWRNEIQKVGMNHKSIADAKAAASEVLDSGMAVAEDTAKELVRLKDVGIWKLAAREVSDNFDTRSEPPPLRRKHEEESDESEEASHIEHDESVDDSEIREGDSAEKTADGSESVSASTISGETETDTDSSQADEHEEAEPTPVKSAFGVAAANANSHQAPIIDDDEERFHNLASNAGNVYDDASSAFADSTAQAKVLYDIAKSQVMGQMAQSSAPAHSQLLSSIESAYSGAVKYATEEFESRVGAVRATPTPAGPLAHISSVASSRLDEGLRLASEQLAQVTHTAPATSSAGFPPFVLDAQRRYYEAVGLAHDHYTAFVSTASEAVYGSPTPTPAPHVLQNLVEQADSQYQHASSLASASLAAVIASASSMVSSADDGKAQGIIDDASSRYHAALSVASSSLSVASASASSAIYGTTPSPLESMSMQASENWEALVSKASEQIYGTPAPYLQQVVDSQISRFEAVQDVVSELLVGKQPSFTESVMSRLRASYETPYPAAAASSASSYLGEAYETASSVVNAYVTGIPNVEDIMSSANDQLNSAVEAASIGIYGTPKDRYEQASDAAAEAMSTASAAIEGVQSKASVAIHGEPGAMESATSRLAAAVESAQSQLASLATRASSIASEAAETAASQVDGATDSIKSAVSSSSKDEL